MSVCPCCGAEITRDVYRIARTRLLAIRNLDAHDRAALAKVIKPELEKNLQKIVTEYEQEHPQERILT